MLIAVRCVKKVRKRKPFNDKYLLQRDTVLAAVACCEPIRSRSTIHCVRSRPINSSPRRKCTKKACPTTTKRYRCVRDFVLGSEISRQAIAEVRIQLPLRISSTHTAYRAVSQSLSLPDVRYWLGYPSPFSHTFETMIWPGSWVYG